MTRWTDFIKEWAKNHNTTYGCALSNPEMKDEYWITYPKRLTKPQKKARQKTARDLSQKKLADIKPAAQLERRNKAQEELAQMAMFAKLLNRYDSMTNVSKPQLGKGFKRDLFNLLKKQYAKLTLRPSKQEEEVKSKEEIEQDAEQKIRGLKDVLERVNDMIREVHFELEMISGEPSLKRSFKRTLRELQEMNTSTIFNIEQIKKDTKEKLKALKNKVQVGITKPMKDDIFTNIATAIPISQLANMEDYTRYITSLKNLAQEVLQGKIRGVNEQFWDYFEFTRDQGNDETLRLFNAVLNAIYTTGTQNHFPLLTNPTSSMRRYLRNMRIGAREDREDIMQYSKQEADDMMRQLNRTLGGAEMITAPNGFWDVFRYALRTYTFPLQPGTLLYNIAEFFIQLHREGRLAYFLRNCPAGLRRQKDDFLSSIGIALGTAI